MCHYTHFLVGFKQPSLRFSFPTKAITHGCKSTFELKGCLGKKPKVTSDKLLDSPSKLPSIYL